MSDETNEIVGGIAGIGLIAAFVAMVFFHVTPEKIASTSLSITWVLIIGAVISIIIFLVARKKDKYGLSFPSDNYDEGFSVVLTSAGYVGTYGLSFAIISMIFGKSPFSQAIAFFISFLILAIGYAVIMIILGFIIKAIKKSTYESRLANVQRLEKEAHVKYDPLMLKIIEENEVVGNLELMTLFMRKNIEGRYRRFANLDFFFKDGLDTLVSSKKIHEDNFYYYCSDEEAHRIWDPVMQKILDDSPGKLFEAAQIKAQCESDKYDLPKKKYVAKLSGFVPSGLSSLASRKMIIVKKPKDDGKVKLLYQTADKAKAMAARPPVIELDD